MNILNLIDRKSNRLALILSLCFFFFAILRIKNGHFTIMEWFNIGLLSNLGWMVRRHLQWGHLPFYDFVLFFSNKLAPGILPLRYVSAFFSLATLLILYKFTKQILNQRIALLALALLAVNPSFFYYSQQIEAYACFTFIFTLNIYLFWNYMIEGRRKYLFWFYSVSILLFASHLIAIVVIAAECASLLILFFAKGYSQPRKDFLKRLLFFYCSL